MYIVFALIFLICVSLSLYYMSLVVYIAASVGVFGVIGLLVFSVVMVLLCRYIYKKKHMSGTACTILYSELYFVAVFVYCPVYQW